jgi:hypothetical protein
MEYDWLLCHLLHITLPYALPPIKNKMTTQNLQVEECYLLNTTHNT